MTSTLTPRSWLWVLQLVGGLSLLIYPAVVLASIMSLGARQSATPGISDALVRGLAWLMLGYPVIWVALWWVSWRVFRRGRTTLALLLSTPPALLVAAGMVIIVVDSAYSAFLMGGFDESRSRVGHAVAAQNPVAGALLLYGTGDVSWDSLRDTIESADVQDLNTLVVVPQPELPGIEVTTLVPAPITPQSPLALALRASDLERSFDTSKANAQFLEAARLLVTRGATLSVDEQQTDARLAWMVDVVGKGVALPDPRAESENALVVRIMAADGATESEVSNLIFEIARTKPELLTRATSTYGTPLRAALVRNARNHVGSLVYAGAILSEVERAIPSVAHALEQFFVDPEYASFRERYEESVRKAAAASPRSAR